MSRSACSLADYVIGRYRRGHVRREGATRIVPDDNAEDELAAAKKDALDDRHDEDARLGKINWDSYKDGRRRVCVRCH